MSTNAHISLFIEKENLIKTIYLHFDGYINGAGKILYEYYNEYEKVLNLIEMGDISSLKSNIFNSTFFYRDRNEDLNINSYYVDDDNIDTISESYLNQLNFIIEYEYIFIHNKWYVYSKLLNKSNKFIELKNVINIKNFETEV